MAFAVEEIAQRQQEAEGRSAEELVAWGLTEFDPQVAIASSFGAEDVVLIDMAARSRGKFRLFTLDTDFLFDETYTLIDQIEQRYGVRVERTRPSLTPEEQARQFGEALWGRHPDQCCNIRKVEPLTKKLSELKAWITGIRRDQAPTRANARKLEWDARFGLVKFNPIADWTWEQVWDYIRAHNVLYNPLHDRNYPSIGCTYCTRPVALGEDPRAGRWSGFQKTECGLHAKG
ncbi:MAG TPA: phosphoadenylyl-sulfate reductase [Terriglobia bacterium]|nr:phosphoadenylyl-sulfate reductase [Terriglobia bacterium]